MQDFNPYKNKAELVAERNISSDLSLSGLNTTPRYIIDLQVNIQRLEDKINMLIQKLDKE